jgi:hypothetical protein
VNAVHSTMKMDEDEEEGDVVKGEVAEEELWNNGPAKDDNQDEGEAPPDVYSGYTRVYEIHDPPIR